MLGGMDIEKMLLQLVGGYLKDSGWTDLMSFILSEGRADSLISVTHLTRARYFHQVSAMALYVTLDDAFQDFSSRLEPGDEMSKENWIKNLSGENPNFMFSLQAVELELVVLQFVRSVRTGDFLK